MQQDWIFHTESGSCSLRVAGVLLRNGKLLVQRDADGSEFALPGGHVQVGETLEDALRREYREEMGVDVRCLRMLWSEECFWTWQSRRHHNLCFYYLIELADPAALPDLSEFLPHRDNSRVVVGWLPIDELPGVTIYPDFLPRELARPETGTKHFVTHA